MDVLRRHRYQQFLASMILLLLLYPFIVGDLMKLYVAAIALPGAWALLGRR